MSYVIAFNNESRQMEIYDEHEVGDLEIVDNCEYPSLEDALTEYLSKVSFEFDPMYSKDYLNEQLNKAEG